MSKPVSLEEYAATKKSPETVKLAKRQLWTFLHSVYPDADRKQRDFVSLQYLAEHTTRESHIEALIHFVRTASQTHAPLTLTNAMSQVFIWLSWNNIEFTRQETARIKSLLPRPVAITEDEILTAAKIRSILDHSDVMLRAFLLVLSSSGMRAQEAANLRFSDMRNDGAVRKFYLPASRMKARRPHAYRYSEEAAAALDEWLKVRSTYIESAERKTKKCLQKDMPDISDRIFPCDYSTLRFKFIGALESAGMCRQDSASGRYTITFQSFRRWCDSTLKLHLQNNMANEIIGHDEGLSASYRRYPADEVDKAYLEAEPHLRIFAPADYAPLTAAVSNELREQRDATARIAAEMLKQREEIEALKQFIKAASIQ